MSNAGISIALTCYGQNVDLAALPVGETVNWSFTVEDPNARTAIDVTGWTFSCSLALVDLFGNPSAPPALQKSPTIVTPTAGTLSLAWAPVDTKLLAAGLYLLDLWGTDASGNRMRHLSAQLQLVTSPTPSP